MITYNQTRTEVESIGRRGAGIIEETESTLLVHVLNEFDMFVLREDESLTPCLVRDGFWEPWITSWVTRWVRPGMTFLDIGANSGYYSLLADKLVGRYGNVIAYEPNPVYAELLRNTRNVNNATYKIREVAVSDNLGTTELIVPGYMHGDASIKKDFKSFKKNVVKHRVGTTTLNNEVMNLIFFRHDIVKIDAEGAEEMIWKGGQRMWDSAEHTTLMIEWTPGIYSDRFLEQLFHWGTISTVGHDGGEYRVTRDWINSQDDWVMLIVRKS